MKFNLCRGFNIYPKIVCSLHIWFMWSPRIKQTTLLNNEIPVTTYELFNGISCYNIKDHPVLWIFKMFHKYLWFWFAEITYSIIHTNMYIYNRVTVAIYNRSRRLQMFFTVGVLKNFANFAGKHRCWSQLQRRFAPCEISKNTVSYRKLQVDTSKFTEMKCSKNKVPKV